MVKLDVLLSWVKDYMACRDGDFRTETRSTFGD
jgi:hypothetical protein